MIPPMHTMFLHSSDSSLLLVIFSRHVVKVISLSYILKLFPTAVFFQEPVFNIFLSYKFVFATSFFQENKL